MLVLFLVVPLLAVAVLVQLHDAANAVYVAERCHYAAEAQLQSGERSCVFSSFLFFFSFFLGGFPFALSVFIVYFFSMVCMALIKV